MFGRGSFAGPPRCLHHAILLAFSVDPGARAPNADDLCIPIAVAVQRKQPASLADANATSYFLFRPDIEPGKNVGPLRADTYE